MIPEIGHFALILALCVAVVQGILPIYGAAVGSSGLMAVAKPAARGQFLLVATAFGCLACAASGIYEEARGLGELDATSDKYANQAYQQCFPPTEEPATEPPVETPTEETPPPSP